MPYCFALYFCQFPVAARERFAVAQIPIKAYGCGALIRAESDQNGVFILSSEMLWWSESSPQPIITSNLTTVVAD